MIGLADIPYWFLVVHAVALGLLFGSFLNVVIYRLPRGESVAFPGSRCPACGKPIRPWENIPVFSYLLLRGKARCCGVRISPRYPLVELVGGLLAWAVLVSITNHLPPEAELPQVGLLFAVTLALGLSLVAATFIDLEFMILPDSITLGGAALGFLSAPLRQGLFPVGPTPWSDWISEAWGPNLLAWVDSGAGAVFGFLLIWLPFDVLYRRIRGKTGMALGDAKLVLLAGAWFGWLGAVFALTAGALQGTLAALAVFAARGKIDEPEAVRKEREEFEQALAQAEGEERLALEKELEDDPLGEAPTSGLMQARLPFGPFLALAILEWTLYGTSLFDAYVAYIWAP